MPNVSLQPGSKNTAAVKQLQDYLVSIGYLSQDDLAGGYGNYGPKTTAAVAKFQTDNGVDNSTGVGYWGPRTIAAAQANPGTPGNSQSDALIKALQASLGVPQTGIYDEATSTAMDKAVSTTLASNPDTKALLGNNSADDILAAYQSGNWSGVTDLTGKPFTDEQQQAAVAEAEKVLGPAFEAQKTYNTASTEDTLRNTQEGLADTLQGNRKNFAADKIAADENAANQGVLFAGSRTQKMNDIRSAYRTADEKAVRDASESLGSTARNYQYNYGTDAAKNLSSYYNTPGPSAYGSKATPGSLASVYDPAAYNFQGTQPVAQKANVQTRAARQLANTANKLSLSGVGAKF